MLVRTHLRYSSSINQDPPKAPVDPPTLLALPRKSGLTALAMEKSTRQPKQQKLCSNSFVYVFLMYFTVSLVAIIENPVRVW